MKTTAQKSEVTYADPRMAYSSTKKEMVIKETELTANNDNSTAVIAEDQNGLYITVKSNVGAPILDGYRMYRRDSVKIEKTDDEHFTITSNLASFTV